MMKTANYRWGRLQYCSLNCTINKGVWLIKLCIVHDCMKVLCNALLLISYTGVNVVFKNVTSDDDTDVRAQDI